MKEYGKKISRYLMKNKKGRFYCVAGVLYLLAILFVMNDAWLYQTPIVKVPLRYNNDKQKKPLFSRGLSVCRLLFNSFSKLKIDENYKEKRRLFY